MGILRASLSLRTRLLLAGALVQVMVLALLIVNGISIMDAKLNERTRVHLEEEKQLLTAALVAWVAADMLLRPSSGRTAGLGEPDHSETPATAWRLVAVGIVTGLYSGFLGLGGGFVVVPALSRWLGWPLKRAIGTSLLTVAVLAIPGSVAHYLLGHIDLRLALLLACGAVPGAVLGARLTRVASERAVSIGFAVLLAVSAIALAWTEIAGFLG